MKTVAELLTDSKNTQPVLPDNYVIVQLRDSTVNACQWNSDIDKDGTLAKTGINLHDEIVAGSNYIDVVINGKLVVDINVVPEWAKEQVDHIIKLYETRNNNH